METTITALEVFETGLTKSAIKSMAQNAIESVKEQGNVLQVAEAAAAMETFIKELRADESFKEYAREEIGKYPRGYVSPSGAKLEWAETGVKYNFEHCNDIELQTLESDLYRLTSLIKKRQEFLKTIPISGMVVTDKETGDTYEIYPPAKSSTSSYKVSLAK